MDQKQLFLKTLEDLSTKTNSNDWYDMLLISSLIYKLLFDEHPLAHEINTKKIKLQFVVNNRAYSSDPTLQFWSIEDGFDPETSVPHLSHPISVSKDEMYSRPVMVVNGEVITVKDLMRFLRNKQGGVHVDNVTLSDKEEILKEIQSHLGIGGVPAGLRLMRAISRVVVKGLVPLKMELSKE